MTQDLEHPAFSVTWHGAGIMIGPCATYTGIQKDETKFILNGHKDVYGDADIRMQDQLGEHSYQGTIRVDWKNKKITITPKYGGDPIHGTYSF